MLFLAAFILFISTVAALPTHDVGTAVIDNNCDYPLYFRSVDFNHPNPPVVTLLPNTNYSEYFRQPSNGGGVSLKISKEVNPPQHSITQFEYTLINEQLWYDISFVDCAIGTSASKCPGHAEGLRVYCKDGTCPQVSCAPGAYCPKDIYYEPGGVIGVDEPTRKAGNYGVQLQLIICDHSV